MNDLSLASLDIAVDDRDAQATFEAALAVLATKVPEWVPRNGSIEVLLLEAFSTAAADLTYAANRLPAVIVEAMLATYGLRRRPGRPGVGKVQVEFGVPVSATVVAGSRMQLTSVGVEAKVSTTAICTDQTFIIVDVETVLPTSEANGVPAGAPVDLIDAIPDAITATVSETITGGASGEQDLEFWDRARNTLARVHTSLILARDYTGFALDNAEVSRAATFDLWDGSSADPGSKPGHVTTCVYGVGGPVPDAAKNALRAAMAAAGRVDLQVHVIDLEVLPVDVAATVTAMPDTDHAVVAESVRAAVRAYLNPATWTVGASVYPNELVVVIDKVPGVDHVVSVVKPPGPVAVKHLATAGAVDITVLS